MSTKNTVLQADWDSLVAKVFWEFDEEMTKTYEDRDKKKVDAIIGYIEFLIKLGTHMGFSRKKETPESPPEGMGILASMEMDEEDD